MRQKRALVVDDEPDIRDLLSITLGRMDIAVDTAGDHATAVRKLGGESYDLVLTDMRLPDRDGLEIVEWIQAHRPGVPVAVITAHGNVEAAVRALKLGAFDFISKPLDLGSLRKLIAATLRLGSDLEATGRWSAMKLHGTSKPMQQLRDMIGRVVRSQAPVHISGESGTGKELVARLIHESGARKDAPFVPVNCGAIPTELMESELFGHKKGSFTGAVADKEGLIRSAEGGTLFLDEVADLPLHMQVKLLRVIQEKKIRPVGETREIPVDVRILSATHRRLDEMVKAGRFREDLYYRINVIELRVPALRERLDDVPQLVEVLVEKVSRQIGVPRPSISSAAMERLLEYSYPGNVRELENILERAVTLCVGDVVRPDDIQLRHGAANAAPADENQDDEDGIGEGLEGQLAHIERDAIVKALEQARYNKTRAAELLGITFRQLRYRIKKLGIE